MNVRPLHFCDVTVDGAQWPVFGWAIDRDEDTILVDTGMIDSTPELDAQWGPVLRPWPELGAVSAVINTHLHFDHCGGNRRFAGRADVRPAGRARAASEGPDYVTEWAHFAGATYVELDGDADLFAGVSVLSTPGHTVGHQAVVVETADGLVVLGGDVTYSMRELIDGATASIRRIHELRPRLVYLAHHERPWAPEYA